MQLFRSHMMRSTAPQMDFTLFVGPVTCAYHNLGGSFSNPRQASYCPSDVQIVLGEVEQSIIDAVALLRDTVPFEMKSVVIFTACPYAFSGVDFKAIESGMRKQLGILCLHRQHNRMMLADPSHKGSASGMSGDNDIAAKRLFDLIPKERTVNKNVFLVLGADALDPENELHEAAYNWGFDCVQCSSEWNSWESLELARGAGFVLALGEAYRELAKEISDEWGVDYAVMPSSASIEEVDAAYNMLDEIFGAYSYVDYARDAAVEAVDYAVRHCQWQTVELNDNPRLVDELRSWGIEAVKGEDPWRMMRRPRPNNTNDDRGKWSGPARGRDPHFPTSGGGNKKAAPMNNGPMGLRMPQWNQLPSSGSFWGYRYVRLCAERLVEEMGER